MMMVVIAYDVNTETPEGKRRLRRVADLCEDFGQRVQFSVFECLLDNAQWIRLRKNLVDEIDPQTDSLRFYFLGSHWQTRVEHVGARKGYDPQGLLMA
jgi:CRISPR-associated protein Cas2